MQTFKAIRAGAGVNPIQLRTRRAIEAGRIGAPNYNSFAVDSREAIRALAGVSVRTIDAAAAVLTRRCRTVVDAGATQLTFVASWTLAPKPYILIDAR
jgi:hypothetical protein